MKTFPGLTIYWLLVIVSKYMARFDVYVRLVTWYSLDSTCFNACTRFIFSFKKFDHISLSLSVTYLRTMNIDHLFLLKNSSSPANYIILLISIVQKISSSLYTHITSLLNSSFVGRGASTWNSLSVEAKHNLLLNVHLI